MKEMINPNPKIPGTTQVTSINKLYNFTNTTQPKGYKEDIAIDQQYNYEQYP